MKAGCASYFAVSIILVTLLQSCAPADAPAPLPTPSYLDGCYLAEQDRDRLSIFNPPKFFASHRFFSIDLSLDKQAYRIGETIQLLITFTNVSENPMEFLVNFFYSHTPFFPSSHYSISVIVTSPDGETRDGGIYCKDSYGRESFDERNVITISPAESIRSKTDFRSGDQDCYDMDVPGQYSLATVFTNMYREPPIENVWVGRIVSNSVQFELEP